MKLYLMINLLFYIYRCDQEVLNNLQNLNTNEMELTQIINYFRHGVYISGYGFSKDEYAAYDKTYPYWLESTYLGNSQAWSFGRQLRASLSEFVSALSSDDILFVMQDNERTIDQANHISCGMLGNYPDWEFSSINEIVVEAVKETGYCSACNPFMFVPLSTLQTTQFENQTEIDQPNTILLSGMHFINWIKNFWLKQLGNYLFDQDAICNLLLERLDPAREFTEEALKVQFNSQFTDDDVTELIDTLVGGDSLASSYAPIHIMTAYYKHTQHNLPELSLPTNSFTTILDQIDESYQFYYNTQFDFYFEDNLYQARLYDSEILKDTLNRIVSINNQELYSKVITYMMHDNNEYAMYQLITGSKIKESPDYGSNIQLSIYKNYDGVYYVKIYYNEDLIILDGCTEVCPLDYLVNRFNNLYLDAATECVQMNKIA